MAKAKSISKFDNSLTEFLINVMTDKYGDAKSYAYKYNNLKVSMDPRSVSDPHIYVNVGISEAVFSIIDGKKLEGGLGPEDGYVKRWIERTNINKELIAHWKLLKDAITAEESDDINKKASAVSRLRRAETANVDLGVDMTGTGINQTKKEELERKRNRLTGFKKDLDKNTKK